MKTLLLDVNNDEIRVENLNDEDPLADMRKLIGCEWIEAVPIKLGEKGHYIVCCDEEGRFKDNHVSAINKQNGAAFVGNIILCNIIDLEDGAKDLGSLSDKDVEYIEKLYCYILKQEEMSD